MLALDFLKDKNFNSDFQTKKSSLILDGIVVFQAKNSEMKYLLNNCKKSGTKILLRAETIVFEIFTLFPAKNMESVLTI